MKHKAHALVANCIDFRLQKHIRNFLDTILEGKFYDHVAHAGCCKEFDHLVKQVDISVTLHDIEEVYLINHEDCGAYGENTTKAHHINDQRKIKNAILEKYPYLSVQTYYLHLNGEFEEVN